MWDLSFPKCTPLLSYALLRCGRLYCEVNVCIRAVDM